MSRSTSKKQIRSPRLHYAASESDADMLYGTGFFAPDAFLFLEVKGRRMMLLSDLEFDRGKKQGSVHSVLSLTTWVGMARKKYSKVGMTEVIATLLKSYGFRKALVPAAFPLAMARDLEALGMRLEVSQGPFFPERLRKKEKEIKNIVKSQRATERAVEQGIQMMRGSRIQGRRLIAGGQTLTAERVRNRINTCLMESRMLPAHTIVAPGNQAVDPHCEGRGPIRPGQAVVMDVFPRSEETGYYADMTRTVVKGRPSSALARLYDTVLTAQKQGLAVVRAGVTGAAVHLRVEEVFEKAGYRTERKGGRMQGFFHGTGHGLGLEVHEEPRVSRGGGRLAAGTVVTVEPGLYYQGVGGVRLEDLVVVKPQGCRNLTRFPKYFQV